MTQVEDFTFGCVLRKLRKRRGLSLRELAKKADLIHSNLAGMETGRIRVGPIVFDRLLQVVAKTKSEKLELVSAFAASRIEKTSSGIEEASRHLMMGFLHIFFDMGLVLRDLDRLDAIELPRPFQDMPRTRIWLAYEKGTKRLTGRKWEAVKDAFLETKNGGPPLVLIRRNAPIRLFQGRELNITP